MSLSQPCLPVANVGPTRILPHLYLGSQKDVLNKVCVVCNIELSYGVCFTHLITFLKMNDLLLLPGNKKKTKINFNSFYLYLQDLMAQNGITYVLNASNTCPKPDFISESHFMRIPVNDNYCEKLLPWLDKTNEFIGKMKFDVWT